MVSTPNQRERRGTRGSDDDVYIVSTEKLEATRTEQAVLRDEHDRL